MVEDVWFDICTVENITSGGKWNYLSEWAFAWDGMEWV